MSIYEILPAFDWTQSIHDKIMHRNAPGGQILNFQNTSDWACDKIRLLDTEQKMSSKV